MYLKVKRTRADAILPTRAHISDVGYDFYALEDAAIFPGQILTLDTGVAIEPPQGSWLQLETRSSQAANGFVVLGGIVDPDYRGEIKVCLGLMNFCSTVMDFVDSTQRAYIKPHQPCVLIKKGDKIAQGVLRPVILADVQEVTELSMTDRADKGFGSSDKPQVASQEHPAPAGARKLFASVPVCQCGSHSLSMAVMYDSTNKRVVTKVWCDQCGIYLDRSILKMAKFQTDPATIDQTVVENAEDSTTST